MGAIGSKMSQIGVQLTDSPYAVVNMRIMARIGLPVFEEIDATAKRVVPRVHSVGHLSILDRRMFHGRAIPTNISCIFRRRVRFGATAPVTAETLSSAR